MPNIKTDTCTIGSMLRRALPYSVPKFQRDFSWEHEQVSQLWEDINRAIDENADTYFLGSVVLKEVNSSTGYEVIDGQQRLTTISILICALRDFARAHGMERAALQLHDKFIANDEFDSDISTPKFTPNRVNRQYYQQKIVDNADRAELTADAKGRRERKSNRLMASAYVFFVDQLEKMTGASRSSSDFIRQLKDAIEFKVQVIEITVQDDYDAYMLFETLNDRGLALSVADLLKNYLFSRADDRIDDVQDNWTDMSNNLASIETKRFLRHYWLSKFGVVRDKELFKKIKDAYTSKSTVLQFSRDLKKASDIYAALSDTGSSLWSIFDAKDREGILADLEDLHLFGVNQYNPLLLAVLDENQSIFRSVVRMVKVFAFRYSIIAGAGTGNIEKTFTAAAIFVRNNPSCSAKDVFEKISGLYPSDEAFAEDFASKSVTQSGMARYILRSLNNKMEEDCGLKVDKSGYSINLEHILPQKFVESDWDGFLDDPENDVKDYVHRIGNMTLLTSSLNRNISNNAFAEKLASYKESRALAISEFPFSQSEWTSKLVEENQRKLAKTAKQTWRVDY